MNNRNDDLLAFIARCGEEPEIGVLVDAFRAVIRAHGFDVCAGGNWTGVGNGRHYRFYFNDWPKDWLDDNMPLTKLMRNELLWVTSRVNNCLY